MDPTIDVDPFDAIMRHFICVRNNHSHDQYEVLMSKAIDELYKLADIISCFDLCESIGCSTEEAIDVIVSASYDSLYDYDGKDRPINYFASVMLDTLHKMYVSRQGGKDA